jgi:hypothetical protein
MNNVTFMEITNPITSEVIEYAIIDRGNNEFTSMTKVQYNALLEEQANDQSL